VLRRVHPLALERFCERVLAEIEHVSSEFEFFAESVKRANADRFNPANSFASGGSF
jgi:hypothetical protein